MAEKRETFVGWAILELMGHRRLGGWLSEQEIAGAAFIRIDVPGYLHSDPSGAQEEREQATQFYAPGAVYCITPTTEEMARAVAEGSRPRPVSEWELRRALPPASEDQDALPPASEDQDEDEQERAELEPDALPF